MTWVAYSLESFTGKLILTNGDLPHAHDIHGARDRHDPNALRDSASRPGIGHSADGSNTHLRTVGGSIVPAPNSSVHFLHPNNHRPIRSLPPEVVNAVHSARVEECGQ
jgi:hypothetical protein